MAKSQKNPYDRKIPKTWTLEQLEREIDKLHKESRWLGVELENVVAREGWGKATTTIDVKIEDIGIVLKKLHAYRDFWIKNKRRPAEDEILR